MPKRPNLGGRMAKLTADEQKLLDELTAKSKAPDEPEEKTGGRVLNVTLDLSDEGAVTRAIKLGWITPPAADEGDEGDEGKGKGDEGDEPPKRRGYFDDGA